MARKQRSVPEKGATPSPTVFESIAVGTDKPTTERSVPPATLFETMALPPARAPPLNFPMRLFEQAEDPDCPEIGWQLGKDGIVVLDRVRVEAKYKSFTRTMYDWGFRRGISARTRQLLPLDERRQRRRRDDHWYHVHNLFCREDAQQGFALLRSIKYGRPRKRTKKEAAAEPEPQVALEEESDALLVHHGAAAQESSTKRLRLREYSDVASIATFDVPPQEGEEEELSVPRNVTVSAPGDTAAPPPPQEAAAVHFWDVVQNFLQDYASLKPSSSSSSSTVFLYTALVEDLDVLLRVSRFSSTPSFAAASTPSDIHTFVWDEFEANVEIVDGENVEQLYWLKKKLQDLLSCHYVEQVAEFPNDDKDACEGALDALALQLEGLRRISTRRRHELRHMRLVRRRVGERDDEDDEEKGKKDFGGGNQHHGGGGGGGGGAGGPKREFGPKDDPTDRNNNNDNFGSHSGGGTMESDVVIEFTAVSLSQGLPNEDANGGTMGSVDRDSPPKAAVTKRPSWLERVKPRHEEEEEELNQPSRGAKKKKKKKKTRCSFFLSFPGGKTWTRRGNKTTTNRRKLDMEEDDNVTVQTETSDVEKDPHAWQSRRNRTKGDSKKKRVLVLGKGMDRVPFLARPAKEVCVYEDKSYHKAGWSRVF